MLEIKECIFKLLIDNFPAYAEFEDGEADDFFIGASAEDWGDFLAHVAQVIAHDNENLETAREDGDRFAAIVDGFAASVERREW
jgi:hypothetical protein